MTSRHITRLLDVIYHRQENFLFLQDIFFLFNRGIGGGLFADMFKDATQKIRDYIFKNADEFLHIVNNPDFCNTFQVMGSALKNVRCDDKKISVFYIL